MFTSKDFTFFYDLIYKAGQLALGIQKSGFNIEHKPDNSIVTEADFKVQDLILSSVKKHYKHINFVHEENFDKTVNNFHEDEITIIIDPIDGTSVFSMHLPLWCISLGIFKGYEPIYGFVYSPASDFYFYNDNENAYLNNKPVKIVNDLKITRETCFFCASENPNAIKSSFPGKIRNFGSTAFHASLLTDNARNNVFGFIGESYLWDWAGAIPIILKAGGHLSYCDGSKIDFEYVIKNKYRFPKPLVAYACNNFKDVKKYLRKR
jgi:fructose-1,6-bisphosphatase/inositol monophosphatase family enzyme